MNQVSYLADSGSNYSFFDKRIDPNIKRSRFDCSYLNMFSCKQGYLYPVYWQFTQPHENYDLDLQCVIRTVNPPQVPLYTRQRAFFHYYWLSMNQLWKNWQTFMDKGRSGNVTGIIPKIKTNLGQILSAFGYNISSAPATWKDVRSCIGRGSLFDFFIGDLPHDLRVKMSPDNIDNELESSDLSYEIEFNALLFMAYQRIYRDCYQNQNLNASENNPEKWFPYDDADFRLTGSLIDTYNVKGLGSSQSSNVWSINLLQMRSKNYADDYFTTATLTPLRGDEPQLEMNGSITDGEFPVGIKLNDVFRQLQYTGFLGNSGIFSNLATATPSDNPQFVNAGTIDNSSTIWKVGGLGYYYGSGSSSSTTISPTSLIANASGSFNFLSSITWNKLRALSSATRIAEKSMRTDGSYGEFISTFFGNKPRSAQDYRPYYIGGSYQPIVYTEVLQQSQSGNTPLGFVGGKGISSDSSDIGSFYSDDFGFIIGIMSIVPDTIYSTGVNKTLLYEVQEDFPLPERMDLGPQAILNKELFWSGDAEIDNDIYGYIDRYDELRYRANEVHGEMADFYDETFSPYTQARRIETTPTLSQQFIELSQENINNGWLTAPNISPFGVKIRTGSYSVKPIPYRSVPAGLL